MRERALQQQLDRFDPKTFLVRMYALVDSSRPVSFAADDGDLTMPLPNADKSVAAETPADGMAFSCVMRLGEHELSQARGLSGRQASVLAAVRKLRALLLAADPVCLQVLQKAGKVGAEVSVADALRYCEEFVALLEPDPTKQLLPPGFQFQETSRDRLLSNGTDSNSIATNLNSINTINTNAQDNTVEDADLDARTLTGRADHSLRDYSTERLQSYLRGVVWAHMYYGGDCLDYTYVRLHFLECMCR